MVVTLTDLELVRIGLYTLGFPEAEYKQGQHAGEDDYWEMDPDNIDYPKLRQILKEIKAHYDGQS